MPKNPVAILQVYFLTMVTFPLLPLFTVSIGYNDLYTESCPYVF